MQPVLHDWRNKGRGMYYPVCAYKRTLSANRKEQPETLEHLFFDCPKF